MNRVLRVVALALSALVLTALCGILLTANAAFGNVFSEMTDEAKALIDKGLIMKVYQPDKHSGCHVDYIMAESKKTRVAILIFGMEDVGAARSEGGSMASVRATHLAEGWFFLMQCRHEGNRRDWHSEAAKPPRGQTAGDGIRKQWTAAERILSEA